MNRAYLKIVRDSLEEMEKKMPVLQRELSRIHPENVNPALFSVIQKTQLQFIEDCVSHSKLVKEAFDSLFLEVDFANTIREELPSLDDSSSE